MLSSEEQTTLLALNKVVGQDFCNIAEAEQVFFEKYLNSNYKISDPEGDADFQHHQIILKEYGTKLQAILIESVDLIDEVIDSGDESNWIIQSLTQNCTGLKKLELAHLAVDLSKVFSSLPNLTHCILINVDINGDDWTECHLQHLKNLKIKADIRLKHDSFERFINRNQQVEALELSTHFNSLDVIHDKLNLLKQLKIEGPYNLICDHEMIKLNSLESLSINCFDLVPILQKFRNANLISLCN